MHTDESVNAYLTGGLLAGDNFHYDPQDRHGPALFVLAEPLVKLLGAKTFSELTETQLRLTPVILGSATILLIGAGVEMFGFIACLVAALLFAIAPLPVYYSRYFIHETLFVATTLGLILSGWRALGWWSSSRCDEPARVQWAEEAGDSNGDPCAAERGATSRSATSATGAAALAGFCAALMVAGKETAVIHFFALAVALLVGWLVNRRKSGAPVPGDPPAKIILTALGVFLFTAILLFTWFGGNWSVFADLLHAVPRFAARAGGEGHEKPFGYYFHLLDPTFVLFLVAAAGAYSAIFDACNGSRKPGLMLAIYGMVIFLIYSAIPYKTPWLALNFWLPLALLCGLGVQAFWEQIKMPAGRWGVGIAGAFLLITLAAQTKLLAFDKPADEKNPLAYAHTGDDILRLAPLLEKLVKEKNLAQPRIAVIAADAWPLPWYLRKFSQIGRAHV